MLFLPLKFITYHHSLFRLQAKCSTENCTIVNDISYYTRKIAPIHGRGRPFITYKNQFVIKARFCTTFVLFLLQIEL